MRITPQLLNGAMMLAMLIGGAAMSGYVALSPELRGTVTKPLPGYDYLNGKITSSIESTYKDELPIRAHSIDALNAFTLAMFSEGRKGVMVGEKGWLFTAEEYAWTPHSAANLERNLEAIGAIADELKARGVALEIALVPEKADIYADLLRRPRPTAHEGKYEVVRERLQSLTGAPVPDLREAMATGRTRADTFFPTDTHWSVAGAGIAAHALAADFPVQTAAATFALKPGQSKEHEGDLLRFLELGPFAPLLPQTSEIVTPVVAVAAAGDVDAFLGDATAAADPEIALIGTSYSADALWSFEPQLKGALGRDVLNLAEEGHGPMEPMAAFLDKLRRGDISFKAVIWEMPLRYLDDDPKSTTGRSAV
jgi:alginate O-acetyltransferase complex protein AlgJ